MRISQKRCIGMVKLALDLFSEDDKVNLYSNNYSNTKYSLWVNGKELMTDTLKNIYNHFREFDEKNILMRMNKR